MSYIPVSIFRTAKIRDITDVAIAFEVTEGLSRVFLFTGGTAPMVMHLSDKFAGEGGDAGPEKLPDSSALVATDIQFEVDYKSAEPVYNIKVPVGALILSENEIGVLIQRNTRGFSEVVPSFMNDADPEKRRTGPFVAFKKWRVVKRQEVHAHVLIEFESTKTGDLA